MSIPSSPSYAARLESAVMGQLHAFAMLVCVSSVASAILVLLLAVSIWLSVALITHTVPVSKKPNQ